MQNMLEILENSYKLFPNDVALKDEKKEYTYRQLHELAVRFGNLLNRYGKNRPIIVSSERDVRCIVLFWGILYSGNFYVPINKKDNEHKMNSIINTYKIPLIVSCESDSSLVELAKSRNIDYKCFEEMLFEIFNSDSFDSKNTLALQISEEGGDISEDRTAYMVFTSGSTGMPNGVIKKHRSVVRFVESFCKIFPIQQGEIFGNQAEFDYDVAAKDIYLSAYTGGKLTVIPRKCFLMPVKLVPFLEDENVSVLIWAAAAVRFLAEQHCLEKGNGRVGVKKVYFSGEALPGEIIKKLAAHLPRTQFVNLYAPSEVTGNCLYYIINNNNIPHRLPLGRPFPNMEVFLLNENGELANEGEKGEIYIKGPFVASGYYMKNELTKEKFCQNPLHDKYIDIVYKTGDLALWQAMNFSFWEERTIRLSLWDTE